MPVMSSFTPAFDPRGAGREAMDNVRKGQEVREAYDKRKREREARKYLEENPGMPRPEDMWTEEEAALPDDTPPPRRTATEPLDSALPTEDAYSSEAYRRDERSGRGNRRTSSRVEDTSEALPTDGYIDAPVAPRPGQRRTSSRVEDAPAPAEDTIPGEAAAAVEESPEALQTSPKRVIDHDKWEAAWEKRRQSLIDAGRTDEAAKIDEEKLKAEFVVAESILARHQRGIDANDPLAMKDALDEIGQLNPIFQNISDAVELGEDGTLTMGGEKFDKRHMYAVMMNMDQYRQLALEQIEVDKGRSEVAQTEQATRTNAKLGRYYDAMASRLEAEADAMQRGLITVGGKRTTDNSAPAVKAREEVTRHREAGTFSTSATQMVEDLGKNASELGGLYNTPEAVADNMLGMGAEIIRLGGNPDLTMEEIRPEIENLQRYQMGLGTAEELGIEFGDVDTKTGTVTIGFRGRYDLQLPADSKLVIQLARSTAMLEAIKQGGGSDEEGGGPISPQNLLGFFGDPQSWGDMSGGVLGDTPSLNAARDWTSRNIIEPAMETGERVNDYWHRPVRDILSEDVFPANQAAGEWMWDKIKGAPTWVQEVLGTVNDQREQRRENYRNADVQLGYGINVPETDAERRQREAREAGADRKARTYQGG